MGKYEVEGRQATMLYTAILFIVLFAVLVLLTNSWQLLGVAALFFAGVFFLTMRGVSSMKNYVVLEDRISVEGTDKSISFSKIVDVKPGAFTFMKTWVHNGNHYITTREMAAGTVLDVRREVLVYTNIGSNIPSMHGFPCNCYVLTPKDGKALIQELNEKLEEYRSSHPQPVPPTQAPP